MNRHRVFALLVAVISAGWILPLWLGIETYLSFWRAEGWPLLLKQQPQNSFAFFPFASSCFQVAFAWLGLVVAFWAYVGFSSYLRTRQPPRRAG